jgi:hypothetical protein
MGSGPELRGYSCWSPTAWDGHLYFQCATPFSTLIYDLDVAVPALVGQIPPAGRVIALQATDGRLYRLTESELEIWDLADPTVPVELGAVALSGVPTTLEVQGNIAAVGTNEHRVYLIDVSDPRTPREAGSLDSGARDLALAGSNLLIGAAGGGLRVATIAESGVPALRGSVPTFQVSRVVVAGEWVYSAQGATLRLASRDPAGDLWPASELMLPAPVIDIAADQNRVYVLADAPPGAATVLVIDVTDHSSPAIAGSLELVTEAQFIAVDGPRVVVSGGGAGVRVIDVADAAAPVEVGSAGEPQWAVWDAASGGYAYAADPAFGLRVLRTTGANAPLEVGSAPIGGPASPALAADRLYVIGRVVGEGGGRTAGIGTRPQVAAMATPPQPAEERLVQVDVSDPRAPSIMGVSIVADGWPWATRLDQVAAADRQAFVLFLWASGDWWHGVQRFVDGRTRDRLLDLPDGHVSDMATGPDYLYLANSKAGLVEISAPPGPAPPETPTPTGGDVVFVPAVETR